MKEENISKHICPFGPEWFALPKLAPVRLLNRYGWPKDMNDYMYCEPHDDDCQCPYCQDAHRKRRRIDGTGRSH